MASNFDLFVYDSYAAVLHKAGLDTSKTAPAQLPSWVPATEQRRLLTYLLLWSYRSNIARAWSDKAADVDERREFGDPALVVSRTAAGVLGDSIRPLVVGADRPPLDAPTVDMDEPPEPDENATPAQRRILERQRAIYDSLLDEALDEWEAAWDAWPTLREVADWLEDWWSDDGEQVQAKIVESETEHTIPLGDGVLILHASTTRQRPILTVEAPDAYFPVLDGLAAGEFPHRIHIAHEEKAVRVEDDDLLHRTTYHLGPVLPARTEGGALRYLRNGEEVAIELDLTETQGLITLDMGLPHHTDPTLVPVPDAGTRIDEEGDLVREYPWGESDAQSYVTSATWKLAEAGGLNVPDLRLEAAAEIAVTEAGDPMLNLAQPWDFLPVIHVPGFVSSMRHFGQSMLTRLLHIFDSLADVDTDLDRAAALAAGPLVLIPTDNLPEGAKYEPGTMVGTGANTGAAQNINASVSLLPLGEFRNDLLERLEVVSEIGRAGMGRVTGDQVPSGVALRLSFTTFEQLISFLRITRTMKYSLLQKMTVRMGQAMEWLVVDGLTETPRFGVVFGNTTPTDVEATVAQLASLLQAHGISQEVVTTTLKELGFAIDDVTHEVERVFAQDIQAAKELADATGSEALAAERLGLQIPEEGGPTPPTGAPPQVDEEEGEELPGPLPPS